MIYLIKMVRKLLRRWARFWTRPYVLFYTVTPEETSEMSSTRITTTEQQTVTAKFVNFLGIAVAIDGIPQWRSSDESVVTVTPSTNGLSAVLTSGAPGLATVTCTGDSLLGDGVVDVAGVFEVEVTTDPAVAVEFSFEPAVRKA